MAKVVRGQAADIKPGNISVLLSRLLSESLEVSHVGGCEIKVKRVQLIGQSFIEFG